MRSPQQPSRFVAVMATLLMATECSSSAQTPGTVKVLISGDPEELAAFRTLADAYERAVPGADIQLIETSDAGDLITR